MKPIKVGLHFGKSGLGVKFSVGIVAEVQECTNCLNHFRRYEVGDRWKINLKRMLEQTVKHSAEGKCLHEPFGIVPSPLCEVSTLREIAKAWK